jgi:hypothetical protein
MLLAGAFMVLNIGQYRKASGKHRLTNYFQTKKAAGFFPRF